MKSPEELFGKYAYANYKNVDGVIVFTQEPVYTTDKNAFISAIAEHDKEIIALIDEMIEEENSGEHLKTCSRLVTQALTELKNKILEVKK